MNEDDTLEERFAALGPSARQRARLEAALEPAFSAAPASLVAEWLELLRIRPLLHGAMALAAATALGLTSPLASLPLALLRSLR